MAFPRECYDAKTLDFMTHVLEWRGEMLSTGCAAAIWTTQLCAQ